MCTVYPVFRFDFNSPFAYLAAERIGDVLPEARWQPIGFAFLLAAQRRIPWSMDERREEGIAECERRARDRGLPPIAWVDGWPAQSYSLDPLRARWWPRSTGCCASTRSPPSGACSPTASRWAAWSPPRSPSPSACRATRSRRGCLPRRSACGRRPTRRSPRASPASRP